MAQHHRSEPSDIRLGVLSIWVDGWQFPSADDYWDSNWLNIEAVVEAEGARVRASGAILRSPELGSFADELESINKALEGSAKLDCMEPNLTIDVECGKLGQVLATVFITPNHLTQKHTFEFELNQTHLGPLLASCRNVLSRFPIRGNVAQS